MSSKRSILPPVNLRCDGRALLNLPHHKLGLTDCSDFVPSPLCSACTVNARGLTAIGINRVKELAQVCARVKQRPEGSCNKPKMIRRLRFLLRAECTDRQRLLDNALAL